MVRVMSPDVFFDAQPARSRRYIAMCSLQWFKADSVSPLMFRVRFERHGDEVLIEQAEVLPGTDLVGHAIDCPKRIAVGSKCIQDVVADVVERTFNSEIPAA